MIQIKSSALRNLDQFSKEHYNIVKERIIRNASELIPKYDYVFLEENNLFELITAKPVKLLTLNTVYNRDLKCSQLTNPSYNDIIKNISKVIDYEWFTRGGTTSPAYDLSKKLNFNTCPYCNRNYTITAELTGKNKGIRPDFDHFFPKSDFPLLALSFYNLIPSCLVCNRSVKTSAPVDSLEYIHPYLEGFDSVYKFNYHPVDHESAIGLNHNLEISFEPNNSQADKVLRCEKNNILFKLDEIYQASHTSEVGDLLRKHYVSNGKYLSILSKTFPEIGSKDELYRLAFGNYYDPDHLEKRPLSKLTKDIVDQLGFY